MASYNRMFKIITLTSNLNNFGSIRYVLKTKRFTINSIRQNSFKHMLNSEDTKILPNEILKSSEITMVSGNNSSKHTLSSEKTKVFSNEISKPLEITEVLGNSESDDISSDDLRDLMKNNESALDECVEDLSDISPYIYPSYNLAAYVNKSSTLQELVKLGVNLYKLEKKKNVPEYLLTLDFEQNIKGHLRFLHDVGVPADELGDYLTKNIDILKQDLLDMQTRINYLQSKKFTQNMISRIISKEPKWLNFSVIDIDKRLGFFQRTFTLSGEEVRELATKRPTLITYNLCLVEKSIFSVKEEMGFSPEETKQLLLIKPKLFTISIEHFKSRFDFVHNEMKISHESILAQPNLLLTRDFIIKQRHLFLQSLGRAQYNPKLPLYVSLDNLVRGNDAKFCQDVAKTTVHSFNMFLKSL